MGKIREILLLLSIQIGNTKLGMRILSVSLPPVLSCPGASVSCLKECFGRKSRYHSPVVQISHKSNLEATKEIHFVEFAIERFNSFRQRIVRVHAVGDFYENEDGDPDQYVRDWQVIVDELPDKHFYAYTRSWTVPSLKKELRRLGNRSNFTMWLSCDHTMPEPPSYWDGFKRAYMSVADDDVPSFPVDLVFRAGSRKSPMKKDAAGNQICPYEQGIRRKVQLTCSSCGICFDHKPVYSIGQVKQLA